MVGPPPLTGIKVIELAGLAPGMILHASIPLSESNMHANSRNEGPFAGLLLADAGASVLRIDRPGESPTPDALTRHKTSIAVSLKSSAGVRLVLRLAREADVLIEPFRPGVMERLGLSPSVLLRENPRLIYARMTGFRRDGRYRDMAGHDINYLAVSGALSLLGRADQPPTPPVNILGDFAGGGAMLFQGVLLALLARERTGRGQVVEANMVDGASYLATFPRLARRSPMGDRPRGENVLDSGCPWYDTYATRDEGGWMAVGALEPQFFAALVRGLGLEGQGWEERRYDRACWGELREIFARVFKSRTRAEWEGVFDGTDACCTPVLDYGELERGATARRESRSKEDKGEREGDQRPAVTLRETPCLAIDQGGEIGADDEANRGQGPGVDGGGYDGRMLVPGEGGEETLKEWLGWEKGRHFEVEDGGIVMKTDAKL